MYIHPMKNQYAALFVHPTNQTLLWEIIQKSPRWSEFVFLFPQQQEAWFRENIRTQYELITSLPTPEIPKAQWLTEQNKTALKSFAEDFVRLLPKPTVAAESQEPVKMEIQSYSSLDSASLVFMNDRNYDTPPPSAFDMERERREKIDKAKTEFEQFQRKYNTMLERPSPVVPTFAEDIVESKITNMDELLKKHAEMREQEAAALAPPPPTEAVEKKNVSWSDSAAGEFAVF